MSDEKKCTPEEMMEKRIGYIWMGVLAAVLGILTIPFTRELFKTATASHPYIMGAIKVGLLGAMGDMLAVRMTGGKWRIEGIGIRDKVIVWAFLGLVFTIMFPLFGAGTEFLFAKGYIANPFCGYGAGVMVALVTSSLMNIVFAPGMMVFHRVTDTAIAQGGLFRRWSPTAILSGMNWASMNRIVFPAILWFWIPAHTITFLLPGEFRVVFAALLAIVLGFMLAFAAMKSRGN